MATSRRQFLRRGWEIGGSLLALAAGWTTYESIRPLAGSATGAKLKLAGPGSYPPDTATYVVEGRLWVANTGTQLFALSQKCPHLGCRVPFCESSGHFECPCHGSRFDIGGEWIQGPAPRGMDKYALSVDGANLVVDTSKVLPGPDRGAKAFFKPAKGPSCVPGG
ncbi:MAG TPA: ubiquinol-cytochrome c reductase iron-sulfur subunit [Acidimicrobiales bacterium]|nr:ubiquinol-cytochrome c reductase iron-sulfur subunit [Acidimicrobiales bacterium]